MNQPITCPWCGSSALERLAQFGPRLMTSQYLCTDCRSPVEVIRNRGASRTTSERAKQRKPPG